MVSDSPFLSSLDSSLRELIPSEPIEVFGEWSTKTRKTYQSSKQKGSGVGPFLGVEDREWIGTLNCRTAASGIVFLLTTTKIYWVKAPVIALTLPVAVSLHAYAENAGDKATFTAGMGGAFLPGICIAAPTRHGEVCSPEPKGLTTGCVFTLAQTDSAAFVALALPGSVLRMGRKRLWRLRDNVASALTPDTRKLLTRRRSGEFDI